MSDKDFLSDRRKALEEQFFAKQNQQLLEDLRRKSEAKEQRQALSSASGITNEELLDKLITAGVHAETLAALSLIPLVAVAWADGKIQDEEREATLKAAEQSGLRPSDDAYTLLAGWLDNPPGDGLLESWKSYTRELHSSMEPAMSAILKKELLGRAEGIAESAGGFLGLGSISAEERQVLQELESVFR